MREYGSNINAAQKAEQAQERVQDITAKEER